MYIVISYLSACKSNHYFSFRKKKEEKCDFGDEVHPKVGCKKILALVVGCKDRGYVFLFDSLGLRYRFSTSIPESGYADGIILDIIDQLA